MLTFPNIDPVAVDLGIIQIRWYGISYIAGILGAWALLHYRAKSGRFDWTTEQVADLIFYGILGVILGGRLGSVLFYNLPYYLDHPLDVVKVWQGGMSFHGGLLGVIIAVWLYGRKINKAFFEATDFLAPVVPVGLFTGRIGTPLPSIWVLSMRNYGANRQTSPGQWFFPMPAHCRGTRPSCMKHSWKGCACSLSSGGSPPAPAL